MTEVRNWEDLPLVLDTKQAAELLDVTVTVIKKLCADGTLPANKVGRAWRIDREALRAYLRGSSAESRSAEN